MLAKEYDEIYSEICYLTSETTKNWQELLKYADSLELDLKRKFLWVWPEKQRLESLRQLFETLNLDTLLSIGCGNGLLEWLLTESIGIAVSGLEIDRNWWQSAYAVQSFIPLNYVEDLKPENGAHFLAQCCHKTNWNFALLFCYFNNRKAFHSYLNMYQGNYVVIIGPILEADIHTDPSPLQPNFPADTHWQLVAKMFITPTDIITFFKKS